MVDLVSRFFRQANTAQRSNRVESARMDASHSGSTLATVAAPFERSAWMALPLLVVFCIGVGFYLVVFVYFALTQPDAIRSERYTLTKYALERGLHGDNIIGILAPESDNEPSRLPPPASLEDAGDE